MPDFSNSILNLISGGDTSYQLNFDAGDYIRVTVFDEGSNNVVTTENGKAIFYSNKVQGPNNYETSYDSLNLLLPSLAPIQTKDLLHDFIIYTDDASLQGGYYLKPNTILADNNISQGNYTIQIDFLRQYRPSADDFIITQISPSRLEARLKLLSGTPITEPMSDFNTEMIGGDEYQFDHIFYVGDGRNIPIVNHTWDNITDGENNQSIILKFYEPLPSDVSTLLIAPVEKELLLSQTEEVLYLTDISPQVSLDGLPIDFSSEYTDYSNPTDTYENLDNITSSLADLTPLNQLLSGSVYNYPNLNVDYNNFENHVFFGSAVKKLENFKEKVSNIHGYFSNISSSLSSSGIHSASDSSTLISTRQLNFQKIEDEIKTFTPYERFLYLDGQSQTTASAPSVGNNYAHEYAIRKDIHGADNPQSKMHSSRDGFQNVYFITGSDAAGTSGKTFIFKNTYRSEDKPFFNYSGSVYLSFLMKGSDGWNQNEDGGGTKGRLNSAQSNTYAGIIDSPKQAKYSNWIENPSITGSIWKRWIFESSQSYWSPIGANNNYSTDDVDDWTDTTQYEILNGNIKTGSNNSGVITTHGDYTNFATVVTSSGVSFTGSIMPSGDHFLIRYSKSGVTSSAYITDVKVTTKDPQDVLPFGHLYSISSSKWNDWYDIHYKVAQQFDDNNIHSFKNNLPQYIRENDSYDELNTFLALQGEHYDLVRLHIDNFSKFYNTNYNEIDAVPNNLLPILANNLGWNVIQPFSSSLAQYFGSHLSPTTNVEKINNDTWRKSLNNLMYIYKSKGTKNAIRALLNIYGYPPDVINITEFGSSAEEHNPTIITDELKSLTNGVRKQKGNISYILNKEKLYYYNFNNNSNRTIKADWWTNNAQANTIEFVYKHKKATSTQELLKSSGSYGGSLWDLRLLSSVDGLSGSFEFRLSQVKSGKQELTGSAISMSTDYTIMHPGQLWNVMLQRMTGSVTASGKGTNEYKLAIALQDEDKISTLNAVSMSVSGGITVDGNHLANQNWHSASVDNSFYIGRTTSGSMAEFKAWTTALSASKFKQHVLNKFSVVGNSITAHKDELVYHYRLNENWVSSSANPKIYDSNPKGPKSNSTNYELSVPTISGSALYGYDLIDVYTFSLRGAPQNQKDDNKIIISPTRTITSNLNPFTRSTISLQSEDPKSSTSAKQRRRHSDKLELIVSPTTYIDNFIINNLADYDISSLFGNPQDYYEATYDELDTFRKNFFDTYNISVDVNTFVRTYENIFNTSVTEFLGQLVPARAKLDDVGVEIKPNILEKTKIKHHEIKTEEVKSPEAYIDVTGSFDDSQPEVPIDSSIKLRVSESLSYEKPKELDIVLNVSESANYETPKELDIVLNVSESANYEKPKELDIVLNVSESANYELPKESTIKLSLSESANYETPKESTIVLNLSESMDYETSKNSTITLNLSESIDYELAKDASIVLNVSESANYETPKNSTIVLNLSESIDYELAKDAPIVLNVSESANYETLKQSTIVLNLSESIDYELHKEMDLILNVSESAARVKPISVNIVTIPTSSAERIIPLTGSNDFINTHYTAEFRNLHNEWGTGSNDTHFIHYGASGSNDNYNVHHIDDRFVFRTIGDTELQSGSMNNLTGEYEINHNNIKTFLNRQYIDLGEGYKYKSYLGTNPGTIDGKMLGKTTYYTASADGTLYFPSNHVSNFTDRYNELMYEGTSNNPGSKILTGVEWVDFSTASFYTVKVKDDVNEAVINQSSIEIDDKGNIK